MMNILVTGSAGLRQRLVALWPPPTNSRKETLAGKG